MKLQNQENRENGQAKKLKYFSAFFKNLLRSSHFLFNFMRHSEIEKKNVKLKF